MFLTRAVERDFLVRRTSGASPKGFDGLEVWRKCRLIRLLSAMSPLISFILIAASVGVCSDVYGEESFEVFLDRHCIDCHGPQKEEGGIRFDKLSREFKAGVDSHHWAEALEKVNSGEMPPKGELRPTQQEIAEFVVQLDARMKEGRAARMAARPLVAHYRLSRKEYQNTVYDLLGVSYDPTKPGELNEDTLWHGFERIGSELSLSPSHMDRYYRAAEIVLDRALSTVRVETRKVRKTAAELLPGGGKTQQAALDRFGIKRPLRCVIYPGAAPNAGPVAFSSGWLGQGIGSESSGRYRVRIKASGIRPLGGQTAHLTIGIPGESENPIAVRLIGIDITAPEDNPEVYESELSLEMPVGLRFNLEASNQLKGLHFHRLYGGTIFTHSSETLVTSPSFPQLFDDQGNGLYSLALIDWIEWEGPLVSEAEMAKRDGLLPPDDATPEIVAEHLHRFAERAWRRPVGKDELERYLHAYRTERQAGERLADAYRVALQGVLTSRHFIYLVEGDKEPRQWLTDSELASRLSYFLWSSMPDDGLLAAARSRSVVGRASSPSSSPSNNVGRASSPSSSPSEQIFDVLEREVDRMLADVKVNRFIDDFARQWLQLHRVGMFTPDKNLYPNYEAWLETSMKAEPVEFFRELFDKNLSVDSFIDSDWTMANARLCEFYGLPEPKTGGFQRVALKPEDHRGGLLTMGAVLGLTSDGTRHRPVHRGVWLSEVIFNKTPPPPPANVDPIEPNPPQSPKATIREKLAAHAQNANCAACHQRIDPLGFALEQYDAIGQWRTHERVPSGTGEDPVVDASGVLPDGRDFQDVRQFKQLLLEDRGKFLRAFIEHVSTYALRRVLTVDDADDIQSIVEEAKKNEYGVRDLVRAIALSELMRKR
jgi:mono/diheme cytochrome c family protein